MSASTPTTGQLRLEIDALRARLAEAEATLDAIRSGEVDALVVSGNQGEQIYTLKDADRPYRVLIEEMQQGAVTLDMDGTILFSNRRLSELLRVPHAKLLGGTLREYVRAEDRDAYDVLLRSGLAGNAEGEVAIQPVGAGQVAIYLTITALPLDRGIAGALVTDLTAQKRHDAQRIQLVKEHAARVTAEEARAALSASEERERARAIELETMMEAVPAAVVVAHDPECRRITGNGRLFDMLRLPRGDTTSLVGPPGKSATPLRIMRDGREIPPHELPLQLAAGRGIEVRDALMELHFGDGSVRHIFGHASPLRGPDGKTKGAIGAFVDITDRKRAEEALKDADRRKDEFLATLAHELRNPLAPMRNSLEIQRLSGDARAQAAQTRVTVERQLKMMVRLVDDLLDVSRISTGKIELRTQPVNLARAISDAVESCRVHVESCAHSMSVVLPPDTLWIDADPTRLMQMLANLLDNAAKYTPAGGSIRVTAGSEDGRAMVSIADSGIGIAPEMLGRIFELFTQVDPSVERSFGGLGIGLTLVRRLVELHNGTIEARSAGVGHGSEFIMRLPLAEQPRASAPAQAAPAAVASGASRKLRVLVVDDNVDAATTLGMLLRLMGNDVQIAHDGPAALTAAAAFKPQAIFLDIGLPEMSGYQVAQRMRDIAGLERPYLIALTGYGSTVDHGRSMKAGFDIHIVKPIEPDQLEAVMRSAHSRCAGESAQPACTGNSKEALTESLTVRPDV